MSVILHVYLIKQIIESLIVSHLFTFMRKSDIDVDSQFIERFSSRSYDGNKLNEEEIMKLFEAARWAPSSFNEQPWRFVFGKTEEEKEKYFSLLVDFNKEWVKNSGVLFFMVGKKKLSRNDKDNEMYKLDCGAAWMSIALQAEKMGLSAHAMGGFDKERSFEVLGVDKEEYDVLIAITVGKTVGTEDKSERKSLNEIIL